MHFNQLIELKKSRVEINIMARDSPVIENDPVEEDS